MKAEELMIGDWYNLTTGTVSINRRVDSYFYQETITHSWMRPIELTPEILEKNGFIQDYSYDECLADNCFIEIKGWSYHADNILITWDGGTCKVVNDMGSPCDEITLHSWCRDGIYVHELQRALRCCGLWELAENFEV